MFNTHITLQAHARVKAQPGTFRHAVTHLVGENLFTSGNQTRMAHVLMDVLAMDTELVGRAVCLPAAGHRAWILLGRLLMYSHVSLQMLLLLECFAARLAVKVSVVLRVVCDKLRPFREDHIAPLSTRICTVVRAHV